MKYTKINFENMDYSDEQNQLFNILQDFGIKDQYMTNQLIGLISELRKGFNNKFVYFPSMTYTDEKIRNIKSRIEDFKSLPLEQRKFYNTILGESV